MTQDFLAIKFYINEKIETLINLVVSSGVDKSQPGLVHFKIGGLGSLQDI